MHAQRKGLQAAGKPLGFAVSFISQDYMSDKAEGMPPRCWNETHMAREVEA